MSVAADGEHEQALEIYATGLAIESHSLALRSHRALSLFCLGRKTEARDELERVVAGAAEAVVLPLAWMLLARICADEGNCARAVELLEEFEMAVPGEKSVKRFLGAMRQIGR